MLAASVVFRSRFRRCSLGILQSRNLHHAARRKVSSGSPVIVPAPHSHGSGRWWSWWKIAQSSSALPEPCRRRSERVQFPHRAGDDTPDKSIRTSVKKCFGRLPAVKQTALWVVAVIVVPSERLIRKTEAHAFRHTRTSHFTGARMKPIETSSHYRARHHTEVFFHRRPALHALISRSLSFIQRSMTSQFGHLHESRAEFLLSETYWDRRELRFARRRSSSAGARCVRRFAERSMGRW